MVKGIVALMGSGELSGTMVETHKALLSHTANQGKTLFLDTPAGFQENVDLLARRAVEYFENQVGHSMEVASFKSAESVTSEEAEKAYQLIGEGGFVLIGPGSPTYTVRQLKETPIPALFNAMVSRGGCLVLASAAALTAGSHTIPVYEIYKVGEPLHWAEGLNVLGALGLDIVVVPHWNNAEGGNHDTRFCYMGEKRFRTLESKLPQGTTILGIDEHTACILNFSTRQASIEGIGQVTIRCDGAEQFFGRRGKFSFEELFCVPDERLVEHKEEMITRSLPHSEDEAVDNESSFWKKMHALEKAFKLALEENDMIAVTTQLLETDRLLWQAQLDLENPEFISQGREIYREMIVLAGTGIERVLTVIPGKLNNLINELVELREHYRREKRWQEADRMRDLLQGIGVTLEDTREGPRWRL